MVVARFFNWPPTLELIGFPKDPIHNTIPDGPIDIGLPEYVDGWFSQARHLLHTAKAGGEKVFSSAYIVSTNGVKMNKIDYVIDCVLTPLWRNRNHIIPAVNNTTVRQAMQTLICYNGISHFLADQIVTDLTYTRYLRDASDINEFC